MNVYVCVEGGREDNISCSKKNTVNFFNDHCLRYFYVTVLITVENWAYLRFKSLENKLQNLLRCFVLLIHNLYYIKQMYFTS